MRAHGTVKLLAARCLILLPVALALLLSSAGPAAAVYQSRYDATYYNFPSSHPDMEQPDGAHTGLVNSELPLTLTPFGSSVIHQFDWFDSKYSVLSAIDGVHGYAPYAGGRLGPGLILGGGINTGLLGDPQFFAVRWKGTLTAPAEMTYYFDLASDDDAWVFIDGHLLMDNGGVHAAYLQRTWIDLLPGRHAIEVYYADRHTSTFYFELWITRLDGALPPPEVASIWSAGDTYQAACGQTLTVPASTMGVLVNDSADAKTAQLVATTAHGTLSLAANGGFAYTPTAGWTGQDTFMYTASNLAGDTSVATTVKLNVTTAPVASAPAPVITNEDTDVEITLPASDAEGDALTYSCVDSPAHGLLSWPAGSNKVTYRPLTDYHGPDSFTFKANDGTFDSNVAEVSITVTSVPDAPRALAPPTVWVGYDNDTPITLGAYDGDGDPVTYTLLTQPEHGTLSGTPPNLSYRRSPDYFGPDGFTFKVNDGMFDSNVATVHIQVVSDGLPRGADQVVTTPADTPYVFGGQFGFSDAGDLTPDSFKGIMILTRPEAGTLEYDGHVITEADVADTYYYVLDPYRLMFTPAAGGSGSPYASFTFKVCDSGYAEGRDEQGRRIARARDANSVTINVTRANRAPVADSQSVATSEDQAKPIALTATDLDGDPLLFTVLTPPAHGTLTGVAPDLTYTPNADYNGPDSFTFKANDGTDDSGLATVTIDVAAVNDAPALTLPPDLASSIDEGVLWSFTAAAYDPDDAVDALVYTLVDGAGSVPEGAAIGADGVFTWTPTEAQGPGDYSFAVRVSDDGDPVLSDTKPVTVHVAEVNSAPALDAIPDQSVDQFATLTFAAAATDADLPANVLMYSLVDGAGSVPGGATIGADGHFTWTPSATQGPGVYTFAVNVSDGGDPALTDTTAVQVTVNDVTPPETAIGAGSPRGWIGTSAPAFSWSGTDDFTPSDELLFSWKLDGGDWSDWAADTSVTLAGVADGPYTFVVKAKDAAGNSDPDPASRDFSVDTTPPAASAIATPGGWTNGAVSVGFDASDGGSGIAASSATCIIDGVTDGDFHFGSAVAIDTPGTTVVSFTIADAVGNAATATATAFIDRADPTTSLHAAPSGWTQGPVTVTLAASDTGGSDVAATYYQVGAGPVVSYGGPFSVADATAIGYWSEDEAGNVEGHRSFTPAIDRTPPTAPAVSGGDDAWHNADVTLHAAGANDGDGSGVDHYQYSLDNGASWQDGAGYTVAAVAGGANDGAHTVLFRAVDVADNVGPAAGQTVKIDCTKPVVSFVSPVDGASYLLKQTVAVDWSAVDPGSASNPATGSGISTSASTPAKGTPLDTATVTRYDWVMNAQTWRTVTVTASDNAGNTASVTARYRVVYNHGIEFLDPIDWNGNSCFKLGSTVPVKFQLKDASGAPVTTSVAAINVRFLDGSADGLDMEAVSTAAATTGTLFRVSGDQYIFNLSTKNLKVGDFNVIAQLDDGTTISEKISIRK